MLDSVVQGVLLGGLYALFAAGLTLVFGVMRIVNLAHGDLIILGAYLTLLAVEMTGANPLAVAPLVALAMALVGYSLQRGILNRTVDTGLLPPLIVTFGVSIVIQNVLQQAFTADTRGLDAGAVELASLDIGPVTVGWFPMLSLVLAVVIIAGLQLLFATTAIGRAFRAVSDDIEAARMMGIRTRHVFAAATGVAMLVVGIAGVILGIRTQFDPSLGPGRLIFAFEAVIIGGLGSLWGTLAGGIVLGVAQNVGAYFSPGWRELAGHLIFLVILGFRPQGLFGRAE